MHLALEILFRLLVLLDLLVPLVEIGLESGVLCLQACEGSLLLGVSTLPLCNILSARVDNVSHVRRQYALRSVSKVPVGGVEDGLYVDALFVHSAELEPARRRGVSAGVQTRWRTQIKIMQLPKAKAQQAHVSNTCQR